MFERITIGRAHCGFCGTWGLVAVLDAPNEKPPVEVATCERCIRAAVKAADLLALVRKAKAPPPKKARNRAQSPAKGDLRPPPASAVSSLVPAENA